MKIIPEAWSNRLLTQSKLNLKLSVFSIWHFIHDTHKSRYNNYSPLMTAIIKTAIINIKKIWHHVPENLHHRDWKKQKQNISDVFYNDYPHNQITGLYFIVWEKRLQRPLSLVVSQQHQDAMPCHTYICMFHYIPYNKLI